MQKKNIYIGAVILLVVIIGLGAFYYHKTQETRTSAHARAVEAAKKDFDQGNFTQALDQYEKLLASASTKYSEGKFRILIAASLLLRNKGDDLTDSIKMYKSVVSDDSLPPIWHAYALNDIATIVHYRSVSFYKLNFSEEMYAKLLPVSGSDAQQMEAVFAGLTELSDEAYPTSNAEYSLAQHYMQLVSYTNFAPSAENKNYATLAQKYVVEGDSRKDEIMYPPFALLYNLLNRAIAYSGSAMMLKNQTLEERGAAYELVFTTAAKYNLDLTSSSASVLYMTRFYYANFILINYPDRTDKVRELLKPYEQLNSPASPTPAIFNTVMAQSDNSFLKSSAIKLGKVSPEFKAFLTRMGQPTEQSI